MTQHSHSSPTAYAEARIGVMYGIACYAWWGLAPLYFKAIRQVPAPEVLAHRIIWSLVLLYLLVRWRGKTALVFTALADRRTLLTLVGTTLLIAVNWLTFIWAIAHDQLLQASLGYYMNPLINVLLGFVFLRERLRGTQWFCVLLAGIGVTYLTLSSGQAPVLALILGWTFAFYGLLRKTVRADALTGLLIETALLAPLSVGYLIWLFANGDNVFAAQSRTTDLLLLAAGIVTATPLLWFSNAARRLRLSTIGFLQYIAPSLQFLLAVVLFAEPFTRKHQFSFACIWVALALFSLDAWRRGGMARRNAVQPINGS